MHFMEGGGCVRELCLMKNTVYTEKPCLKKCLFNYNCAYKNRITEKLNPCSNASDMLWKGAFHIPAVAQAILSEVS